MNSGFSPFSGSNPFSTRFIAPGKAPFFFDSTLLDWIKRSHPAKFAEFFARSVGTGEELRFSVCLRYLVDKFETHSCRGQIVGEHGSGKTSLLYALKDAFVRQGYEIFSWSQHNQEKFLPDVFWSDLQQFLQTSPTLLPTKFLLPPPVMSREEYVSQQRDFINELFPDKFSSLNSQKEKDADQREEFQAGRSVAEHPKEFEKLSTDDATRRTEATSSHDSSSEIFGFSSAGNFGLKPSGSDSPNSPIFKKNHEPIKFAPFPGVPTNDEFQSTENEKFDEVELTSVDSEENAPTSAELSRGSHDSLEFPLYDKSYKRRSFFDRKILVFDGFEQLSFSNRIIIRTFCRMNHLGLLLTSHTPMIGVPVLFRTIPTVDTIHQLLDYLLEDFDDFKISDSEVETLLKNFHFDAREMLFSLYDAFESFRLAPQDLQEKIVRRYPR